MAKQNTKQKAPSSKEKFSLAGSEKLNLPKRPAEGKGKDAPRKPADKKENR